MPSSTLTRFVPRGLRAVESAVHAAWLRGIVGLFASDGGATPGCDAHPERLLFIRYDRVGDMVLCTGVLRAIAHAYPGMQIDVLTTPGNTGVLSHLPFINEVITHERRRWRDYPALFARLAARRYDMVIDGLVLRPSVNSYTTLLMLASRARWRVGSAGRPHDHVYNVRVAPPPDVHHEHHVDHLARLAGPLGLDRQDADWRPTLALTGAERDAAQTQWRSVAGRGSRILVNISAGQACRRWPDEHFAVVMRELRARTPDARLVVVALPEDLSSATYLAGSVGGMAIAPTLRELFALISEAELVITPDTGVTHISAAFNRPTLTLLRRRAEYEMWVPYHTPSVNVFGPTEASLADLPPSTVVDALDEALSLLPGSSGRNASDDLAPARAAAGAA